MQYAATSHEEALEQLQLKEQEVGRLHDEVTSVSDGDGLSGGAVLMGGDRQNSYKSSLAPLRVFQSNWLPQHRSCVQPMNKVRSFTL